MKIPKATVIFTSLVLSLSLSGCITINQSSPESANHSMHGGSSAAKFSGDEVMFFQMMIPHHQQAIEMSQMALGKSSDPEILALAEGIIGAQEHEIEHMQSWLDDAGADLDMGHEMDMGMLSDAEMTALENAEGEEFDKLFLEGMIAHHEGAIQMTQMILNSDNSEVRTLGEEIVAAQTEEIALMRSYLEKK
jgi:uncharacterized protein (DUF305 family)